MNPYQYSVILFHSTNHALRAEKVLTKAGIASKMIPVPRQLSSDCGVCLRIAQSSREAACRALEDAGVEIESACDLN